MIESDPLRARLAALVATWQQDAHTRAASEDAVYRGRAISLERCAEQVAALLREPTDPAEKLLKRYLDNHCANADAEGMSVLCECRLCQDTRTYLGMPTWEAARAAAPKEQS